MTAIRESSRQRRKELEALAKALAAIDSLINI